MARFDRKWLWYWGLWILLALYGASWDMAIPGSKASLMVIPVNLVQNLTYGLLGLLLVRLSDRRPIESFAWKEWRIWGLHFIASFFIAALGLLLAFIIWILFDMAVWKHSVDPIKLIRRLPYFYATYFHTQLLFMWGLLGAFHTLRIYRKFRAREVEAVRLEARFAEAQNLALRMQLQPHFLFNTLNSVSALIHADPDAADRMVGRLGDFLRMNLDASPEQLIPLRKELAFIESYLAIERIRFQDRLQVRLEIPMELMGVKVPSFILQPVVENALKHGISDRPKGGVLTVRARKDSEFLVLEVQDDGEGFVAGREGVGLSNVRSRLALTYKGRQQIDILGAPGRGTLVVLRIPMDESDAAEAK